MLDLAEQKQIPQSVQVTFQPIDKKTVRPLSKRRFGILWKQEKGFTSYKYGSFVIVSKDFNNNRNHHSLNHYHQ